MWSGYERVILNEVIGKCPNWLNNKKDLLPKINNWRPLVAEPIEHYVLNQTKGANIEAVLNQQVVALQQIADTLEKSLPISNQNVVKEKELPKPPSTFFAGYVLTCLNNAIFQ